MYPHVGIGGVAGVGGGLGASGSNVGRCKTCRTLTRPPAITICGHTMVVLEQIQDEQAT